MNDATRLVHCMVSKIHINPYAAKWRLNWLMDNNIINATTPLDEYLVKNMFGIFMQLECDMQCSSDYAYISSIHHILQLIGPTGCQKMSTRITALLR